MIVKDGRTPFGRIEDQPRQGDALHGLKPILGPMEDGKSWRDTTAGWLTARVPRQRTGPLVRVMAICEVDGRPFLTAHPALARTCGSTCRQRARRARVIAAQAA